MSSNRIIVERVVNDGHRIAVEFKAEGSVESYFMPGREFWTEYSDDVASVPASVGVIAFICNVLPIVWLTDSELYVPEIDEDFLNAIPEIKKGYEGMFPNMQFCGRIVAEKVESNLAEVEHTGCGCFFSGGVDAFCTLYSHMDEHPVLLTLWGADVKLSDVAGWEVVRGHLAETTRMLDIDSVTVRTNFRMFLNGPATEMLVKDSGDMYWHGFHHGIGIIGHGAPVAYVRGLESIYIASSFTAADKGHYKCASDPTIDNMVRYCGTRIVHDGYELNRQQKVDRICEVARRISARPTLRVCWISTGGRNCCRCEKCLRTIFELLVAGENPEDYGFNVVGTDMSHTRAVVLAEYRGHPRRVWRVTAERLRNVPPESLPKWARWIQTADLDNDSHGKDISLWILRRKCLAVAKAKAYRVAKFLHIR